ncbi:MAG TPA: phytoene/squalene synthase family protein [Terriglobales bacterium]|nr:phytoene/squalene synthase family protein [Terriglobales bacterium]
MNSQLAAAYSVCRHLTRSVAKNFYYAFLVLPRDRRDALCAVYAFMRHCDDLSDAPGVSQQERREKLEAWRQSLHRVVAGEPTDDPVLVAVADVQRRFKVPLEWFDQLVAGTAMDLEGEGASQRYQTFEELERYCYHVASVVGLISIRVFGYRDPAAEPLAERCGLAFQLTNIIRDVREDAAMGRVYLPEEDLARFGRSATELTPAGMNNGFNAARFRPVLEFEAQRARQFYRAADDLIPLVAEECRPALWVLVEIYRRLLEKIASRQYDVFGSKVQLTVPEKLGVVAKGFWRRLT